MLDRLPHLIAPTALSLLTGCAVMHSVQLGDIDADVVLKGKPFEIRVSEVGFDAQEAAEIAAAIAEVSGKSGDTLKDVGQVIGLFQMGPRTGKPVVDEAYSDAIIHRLRRECPAGQITGLMMVRETAEYPVVSGEIVRLVGYCRGG